MSGEALLRDSVLDAMRRELLGKDWSAITLTDVARTAGVSRQTIYNEFGSRQGLAQGMRCVWPTVWSTTSRAAMTTSEISHAAFLDGFRSSSPHRPPTRSSPLLSGKRSSDCCRSSPPTAGRSSRTARSDSPWR